ncbi:MAG: hypothetical protein LUO85_03215 [Methanomassiliicoccales archaeon]|nr:hypothetical protein [Methanomassiliicoccales archaeon]
MTTAVAIVATLMFCALSASTACAVEPAANAPTWSQGDSWAMGKSVDLDSEFSEQLDQMQQSLEGMMGNGNLDQFQVTAMASSWMIVEVTSVTDTEYVLKGSLAMRFNGEANAQMTGQMPAAGTKAWDDFNYPNVTMTVSIGASIDMAFVSETTVVFEKSTMAIKSIETTNKASAVASLSIANMPESKFNPSNMSMTYSYKNMEVDVNFDLELNVGATFTPALNLIEFPLSVGNSWSVNSLASITGSMTGFLDIKGLPASDQASMFDNDMLRNAGITGFPIDFSKLSTQGEPRIVNGTLGPINQYVNATMECTGVNLVTLPIYGEVAIYEIAMNGGSEKFYYSDDIRFLTGAGSSLEGLELPVDLGGIQLPEANMTMEPVSAQEAQQNIDSISSYQADLSGEASNSNGGGLGDLMGFLPIIGLIAVIIVVVAVVALVMVKRKKK